MCTPQWSRCAAQATSSKKTPSHNELRTICDGVARDARVSSSDDGQVQQAPPQAPIVHTNLQHAYLAQPTEARSERVTCSGVIRREL